jgi:decaprenylphospho-beta-D-erythro-pentofuranosid-2-ulose 2-reductase
MRKAAILGATKGMGRSVARLLVERGDSVVVLGRDADEVARSADDLKIRGASGVKVASAVCDLEVVSSFAPALEAAEAALDGLDLIIVTAGLFGTQEELEEDAARALRVLTVDFANTVLFCEEARKRLLARGGGTLCVFSSVAGDRARNPVVMYGAAKAGLSAYLDGLDVRFRQQGLVTVCVKPGFVKTAMTEGLKAPPFAVDPDEVAPYVIAGIDAKTPQVYAPPIWKAVMAGISLLPRAVRRRIKF